MISQILERYQGKHATIDAPMHMQVLFRAFCLFVCEITYIGPVGWASSSTRTLARARAQKHASTSLIGDGTTYAHVR